MPDTCFDFGPRLSYHVQNMPTIFIWFLSFGAAALVINGIFVIPHFIRLDKTAVARREEQFSVLSPAGFQLIKMIVAFPFIVAFCKFIVLLSPISRYTMDFVCQTFQAMCLFFFSNLVILFLGSMKSALSSLHSAEPTKFWAVPPFGCCFTKCCAAKRVSRNDLRRMHRFAVQYALFAPLFSFWQLFGDASSNSKPSKYGLQTMETFGLLSMAVAIYGLQALVKASGDLLEERNIVNKAKVFQFTVMSLRIPAAILELCNIDGINDEYNASVVRQAYESFIVLCLVTVLSYFYTRYYTMEDAIIASDSLEHRRMISITDINDREVDRQSIKPIVSGDDTSANADNEVGMNAATDSQIVELQTAEAVAGVSTE